MSYDELDAERDQFFDDLYKEFRASALDDAELYDKIVDDFKASRLRAFYADNPLAAEAADGALAEARALLQDHPKAALVFAVTSAELCMRRVLLTPILHGTFHTESSGEFLVRLLVATKDEKLVKALVAVLASHTGVDLRVLQSGGQEAAVGGDAGSSGQEERGRPSRSTRRGFRCSTGCGRGGGVAERRLSGGDQEARPASP